MEVDDFDSEAYTKELFHEHSALILSDPTLFRKRVIRYLKERTGWERTDAVQEYERVLKQLKHSDYEFVAPLFDAAAAKRALRSSKKELKPDDECFSVIEIMSDQTVGRCQCFLTLPEAEEKYNSKVSLWPNSTWVLIGGLGPNSADRYRLEEGERELKRHVTAKENA